jgi:hypothetical protein
MGLNKYKTVINIKFLSNAIHMFSMDFPYEYSHDPDLGKYILGMVEIIEQLSIVTKINFIHYTIREVFIQDQFLIIVLKPQDVKKIRSYIIDEIIY